jgi:electron transport complex protein RnfB
MLIAIIAISLLALFFGLLLGYSSIRFHVDENPIVEKINEMLPQSQCGQCGFPGCSSFAEAVAEGTAPVNGCPPGGESTMLTMAELLGIEPMPMGEAGDDKPTGPIVAVIDEQDCIGCAVCLKHCPVDAILGTTKQMHTVITAECIGCEACVEPCPVDCIYMEPIPVTINNWAWPLPGDEPNEMETPAALQSGVA